MSENTITPITINVPSLGQADYGENIKQQFLNIDNNFKSIVGNEYLKGDRGANIYIKPLNLLEPDNLQDKFKADEFKALFSNDISDLGIGGINSKILYMLYAENENNDVIAVSSLPYTFLDPRFNPPPTDPVEMAVLNEVEDKSCIVMYNESIGGFTTVNSFPTIYYNPSGVTTTGEADGVGSFCWKINNVETDLPAQGPKGDRGANGFVYFMTIDEEKMNEELERNKIYIVKFYPDLYPNVTKEFDYSTLDGHMGIVWHDNDWYMSPLCYDDVYGLTYSKNGDTNIRNILATQSFREIMLQSHPNNNLNSLFLPKDYPSESTPSHIITTAKFEDEDYFEKNDNPKILVLAPGDVHRTGSGRTLSIPDKEHKFIIGYNNVKIGDKIETKVDKDDQYKTDIKTQLNVEGPTHITGATRIDGDTRIVGDTTIDGKTTINTQLNVNQIAPNNANDKVNEFYFLPAGLDVNIAYPTYWKFLFSGELTSSDTMSKSGLIIGPPAPDKALLDNNDYQMHICAPDGTLHIGNYNSRKSTRVYADVYADDIRVNNDIWVDGAISVKDEFEAGGDAYIGGKAYIDDDTIMRSDATIDGNAYIKGNLFLDGQGIDSKISAIIGKNNQTFLSDYFIEDGAMSGMSSKGYENEPYTFGEIVTILSGYRAPVQIWKSVYYANPNSYTFSKSINENVSNMASKYRIEIDLTGVTSFISQLHIQTAFIALGEANNNKIWIELYVTDANGLHTKWRQEKNFAAGNRYNVETTITFKNNKTIVSGFFQK